MTAPSFRPILKITLISFFVLLIPYSAKGQEFTIERNVFLPSVYFVGDTVELRLTLRSSILDEIAPPQQLPTVSWGEITDIRLINREKDRDVRITFIPYEPGTKTLPPINLGPIVLEGVDIFVSSILDEDEEGLSPFRDQVLLPGTEFSIVLFILLLLLIPIVVLVIRKWGKKYVLRIVARYQESLPLRRLNKAMKQLIVSADSIDGRSFYISLLTEVRQYLSNRLKIAALSLTTEELTLSLTDNIEEEKEREMLINLFLHGDRVKFANQASTIKSRMDHISELRASVAKIEANLKGKVA